MKTLFIKYLCKRHEIIERNICDMDKITVTHTFLKWVVRKRIHYTYLPPEHVNCRCINLLRNTLDNTI